MTTTAKLLGLSAALGAALSASATTYNLGDLIDNNGSLTIGDKVFADFGFFAANFDAHDATVTPSQVDNTYYLTFQGPWVASNGGLEDIGLQYSVATTSGLPLINMIDQSYVLSASGSGFILIGETVRSTSFSGPAVAQSNLSWNPPEAPDLEDPVAEAIEGDNLWITPALSKVYVTKDIFFGADADSLVGPTTIRQSIHQTGLPDGGTTVVLLGAALSGLGLIRRRSAV